MSDKQMMWLAIILANVAILLHMLFHPYGDIG
jgi:hypothetical protein